MAPSSEASAETTKDIVIIGAGAIGLALGFRLLQAGFSVTAYDRGAAGDGATWASAGMLAAALEAEAGEADLIALNLASQTLWPDFAAELLALTGVDVGLRTEGSLSVGFTRDDGEQLRAQQALCARLGVSCEWLSGAEVRALEPHLNPSTIGALRFSKDHQVDNRALARALKIAFLREGGQLHEQTPVTALLCEGDAVSGVVVNGVRQPARRVILAAGAWSRQIGGIPDAALPPVRPVKGQMLSLAMDPAAPLLKHVLWTPRGYCVPRGDGTLLVGATVEEKGFDETQTAGGTLALLEGAWRALPTIEELPIREKWVGFRPGSRDDAPILGEGPVRGLYYATGHYRNGILQTPLTAALMTECVRSGTLPDKMQPFALSRFSPKVAA